VASDAFPGPSFGDEQMLEFMIDAADLAAGVYEAVTVRLAGT